MSDEHFIPIPKDLSVAVVGGDINQCTVFKGKLKNILITLVEEFERGEDAAKRFQVRNFDILYILGEPCDMSAFTLIRAARSGSVAAVFPIVMVVPVDREFNRDERTFLDSYSVSVLKTRPDDEKKIGDNLSKIFATRQQPTSFQMRLEQAKKMLRDGLLTEAGNAFEEMLKDADNNVAARIGLMHASVEKPKKYWKQLKILVAQDPINYNFKFEMVDRYMQEGRAQEASLLLDEVMLEMKTNPQIFWLNELGVVCVNLRFFSLSLQIAERLALLTSPIEKWKADLLLARTHLAAGHIKDSKICLTRATENAGKATAEIENLWAIHARREGDYETAIRRYDIALKLAPGDYRIVYNIGLCYEYLGDKAKALIQYQKALDLNSDFAKAKEKLIGLDLKGTVGLEEVIKTRG